MSNASDFAALKASIMALYQSGVLPHTINKNSLQTIVQTGSGAVGVGTAGQYYTSGVVKDSIYFIDPNAKFATTTPVLAGDLLEVPIGQFTMQQPILNTLSDTKLTLVKQMGITVNAQQDTGYSIVRQGADSLVDDIIAQINAIQADLGL